MNLLASPDHAPSVLSAGANVTLGLPRLREIIMTARSDSCLVLLCCVLVLTAPRCCAVPHSDKIKTPVMEMPLLAGMDEKQADEVAAKLNRCACPRCCCLRLRSVSCS